MVISGCQKDIPAIELTTSPDQLQGKSEDSDDESGNCRLVFDDRDGIYGNFFKYNDRGLVDKWTIDYYDGYPEVYTFTYDNSKRLNTGHCVRYYNGKSYDIKYKFQANKLIRETWFNAGTAIIADDLVNTYNTKGQIIIRKSVTKNIKCTFTYDNYGNNPLVNFYVNDVLVLKEEYSHFQRNRNPLTSLNGIPVILPYYDFVISRWWETSQKWTIYDEGGPTVIIDMDPSTCVMHLGPHKYLRSVSNFDRAVQTNTTAVFEYENCSGDDNSNSSASKNVSTAKNPRSASIAKFKRALFPGQSEDIMVELKKLKKELNQ